jgi:hypothetical protein
MFRRVARALYEALNELLPKPKAVDALKFAHLTPRLLQPLQSLLTSACAALSIILICWRHFHIAISREYGSDADKMTRMRGGSVSPPDPARSPVEDRAPFHLSTLPVGAPDVVARNTISVSDPAKVLPWNKSERQRDFNLLVRRCVKPQPEDV